MPAHGQSREYLNASSTSGGVSSSGRLPRGKTMLSPPATPAITGIDYPSRVEASIEFDSRRFRYQHQATSASSSYYPEANNQHFYNLPHAGGSSVNNVEHAGTEMTERTDLLGTPDLPANTVSLDDIWSAIRQKKERQMAKEKAKVRSLEEVTPELLASNENVSGPSLEETPSVHIPVVETQVSPAKIKKQKSISTLRESTDGKSLVTTFEMPPEVQREDIHVGYHRSRLTVTWSTVEMLEYNEEDGIIYRERYEHTHHRTIPLPDGTKFDEVQALMNGRRLSLRYPNMRCLRVEARSKSGNM